MQAKVCDLLINAPDIFDLARVLASKVADTATVYQDAITNAHMTASNLLSFSLQLWWWRSQRYFLNGRKSWHAAAKFGAYTPAVSSSYSSPFFPSSLCSCGRTNGDTATANTAFSKRIGWRAR